MIWTIGAAVQLYSREGWLYYSEGYVSDDRVGEDGSEQGDVVNGLFTEYEN